MTCIFLKILVVLALEGEWEDENSKIILYLKLGYVYQINICVNLPTDSFKLGKHCVGKNCY